MTGDNAGPQQARPDSRPALLAYVLAPVCAELLSGSTPPRQFFQPHTLLQLTMLYGCGALIAHELAIRWRRGWPAILLLGLAFGLLNEGLCAKSLFSPDWPDLGRLANYGRSVGVNWIWTAYLLPYHAVISIAVPLLLVELIDPAGRGRPWLHPVALEACGIGMAGATLYGLLTFPYPVPARMTLAVLALIVMLVLAARYIPRGWLRVYWPARPVPPWRVAVSALVAMGIAFWSMHRLPEDRPFWPFALFWIVVIEVAVAAQFARRWAGGWSERHSLALVTGVLGFFIVLAPVMAGDPARLEDPSGMTVVALAAAVGLIALGRRVRRRQGAV